MSCFTLTLEPLAGTDITEAVIEAKDKCFQLNLAYVEFNFNGVSVSVGKRANPDAAQEQLMKAYGDKHKHLIVENIK